MGSAIINGVLPTLMASVIDTSGAEGEVLMRTGESHAEECMCSFLCAGSMGDWHLISAQARCDGLEQVIEADISLSDGAGPKDMGETARLAAHAAEQGAGGLRIIARVLSRGASLVAERAHIDALLAQFRVWNDAWNAAT